MDKNFAHEFRPSNESVSLIGIPAVESSDRNDVMKLWDEFRKSAIQSFKYLREKYPTKYKNGLHIYIGEYTDHLWLGFNNTGEFLVDIFTKRLEENLPDEYFTIEGTTQSPIPMIYSYYPDKIIVYNTDYENGRIFKDEEYGTMLKITSGQLFPEGMKVN